MFIAIPQSLKNVTTNISPQHWRIQAIKIKLNNDNLLIINSYFPNDPHTLNFDDSSLNEMFEEITALLAGHSFDHVVLLGDINTDFIRRSGHVHAVSDFLENLNFVRSWEKFNADFSHVHEANGISYTSLIDHFFWNPAVNNQILECGVLHLVDNLSDHSPIYCKLEVNTAPKVSSNDAVQNTPKPSWKSASVEEKELFVNTLKDDLENIEKLDNLCEDVHCQNPSHLKAADDYLDEIVSIMENACEKTLPTPKVKTKNDEFKKKIPGWNTEVKKYQDDAQFWFAIWTSAGRPLNCQLHNIMKKTRNVFHYMLRKCRKSEEKIRSNKLLEACLDNNKNIFEEVKKLRKCKNDVANTIDGKSENVENHFGDIYENLYTSVDDKAELLLIRQKLDNDITNLSVNDVSRVTPTVIEEAIKKLNAGKSDPSFGFTSDCFKAAPPILTEHISNLIKTFLFHGHVSSVLLLATLLPLIKDKLGDHGSSKNYRSIAISSLFLKIFDWVVLLLFGINLQLDDLQFGYQEGISGTMCTWLALETISHFLTNGSEVFTCVMDMTKAFDKVKHSVLFKKLMETNLPAIFIRLLLVMYLLQSADVKWNNCRSRRFSLSNGVKQGAVLSAILYCFYTDGLFRVLRSRRNGCWLFNNYVGIVGYADDNWLLAPTRAALQDMINTCAEYASEHNLELSTDVNPNKSKTKCMIFLKKQRNVEPLKLNDTDLPFTNTAKHLGHFLDNSKCSIKKDMKVKRAMVIQKNNELCQEFFFTHPTSKLMLNQIYNFSYTGCQLWDLFCTESDQLENSYNVSVRKMLGLPINTHRYLIQPLANGTHVKQVFAKRFLQFCDQLRKCQKVAVRDTFEKIKSNVTTTTGKNLAELGQLLNKSPGDLSPSDAPNIEFERVADEDAYKINFIKELIDVKHGKLEVNGFSNDELEQIMDFLCTS